MIIKARCMQNGSLFLFRARRRREKQKRKTAQHCVMYLPSPRRFIARRLQGEGSVITVIFSVKLKLIL